MHKYNLVANEDYDGNGYSPVPDQEGARLLIASATIAGMC